MCAYVISTENSLRYVAKRVMQEHPFFAFSIQNNPEELQFCRYWEWPFAVQAGIFPPTLTYAHIGCCPMHVSHKHLLFVRSESSLKRLFISFCAQQVTKQSSTNFNRASSDTKIVDNVYKVRCTIESDGTWHIKALECLAPNGTAVPVNEERLVDGLIWECIGNESGFPEFRSKPNSKPNSTFLCEGGHPYDYGWRELEVDMDQLYRCYENRSKFLGCSDSDILIPNGGFKKVDDHYIYCMLRKNLKDDYVGRHYLIDGDTNCKDRRGNPINQGSGLRERGVDVEYLYRCVVNTVEFLGCFDSEILIKNGEFKKVNDYVIHCTQRKNLQGKYVGAHYLIDGGVKCKDRRGDAINQGKVLLLL
ncbi:hypothetical protein KIN20_004004 [Parelaphostrongylus tenuis]|uniref:Abnormal cell migration protein 18-like fibronectin type I domain-containing protein n=1 Tax=Parelaphostrongylus tenuis TaxID=148309 RepID=A0AAD5M136_PARTN|nr:hypothetical protein KIN20_004004 [Parelaphostrongylus tenuis]